MPTITLDGKSHPLPPHTKLQEVAEDQLGVPIGCSDGLCGICYIKIQQGSENLSPLTEPELELDMDHQNRLLCQCQILQGDVKATTE